MVHNLRVILFTMSILKLWGFPGGSHSTESACSVGDPGSIPESGISPGEGNDNPLQYSCLGKSHGWRSLVDYSPWGHKESDSHSWIIAHQDPLSMRFSR